MDFIREAVLEKLERYARIEKEKIKTLRGNFLKWLFWNLASWAEDSRFNNLLGCRQIQR